MASSTPVQPVDAATGPGAADTADTDTAAAINTHVGTDKNKDKGKDSGTGTAPGTGARMAAQDVQAAASTARQPSPGAQPDAWSAWRSATNARIALGRAGVATPTAETLRFGWAHALARDAIHTPLDTTALEAALVAAGWQVVQARSQASDRTTYLRRPDLGRRLDEDDADRLRTTASATGGLCLVVGDGLSSLAVQRHAVPLLEALRAALPTSLQPCGPIVLVTQARVAVADDVGECLGAAVTAMLIGERPGLSSPDSLGIYLTYGPRRGRNDAQRNCISNVRPEGLGYAAAAHKLAWLLAAALKQGATGVGLKDEGGAAGVRGPSTAPGLEVGADPESA